MIENRIMDRLKRLTILLAFLLVTSLIGINGFGGTASAAGVWTSQTSNAATTGHLQSVSFGGGMWLAVDVADGNKNIFTSPDGVTWTGQISSVISPDDAIYVADHWVIVGEGSNHVITSPTGAAGSWTLHNSVITSALYSVAYNGSVLTAVGAGGKAYTSTDGGTTWNGPYTTSSNDLNRVIFANGQFIAVGLSGSIFTSSNGTSWTSKTSGTPNDLFGIAYGKGIYVAVGSNGTLLTSPDGAAWTTQTTPINPTYYIAGIDYGGFKFVAVGDKGTILSSTDGITWGTEPSNITNDFIDVTYAQSKFVAIGLGGTLVTQQLSTNTNLSDLTLSEGTLTPSFASGTTSYTADVPNTTTSVNVTTTVADSTATLKVNGSATSSGVALNEPLSLGSNTITIEVTAEDGTSSKSYTVTVTRLSNNANLSGLTLSTGTLAPGFASGTTTYTANVPYTTSSVDVTATVADSMASLKIDTNTTPSGSPVSKTLAVGSNTITIDVTAQDGTPKTYTVTVTRAAPSTVATLSNLTLSAGTLTPSFVSGTMSYTAVVDSGVTSVDVTPTSADGTATITVNGNSVTSGSAKNVLLNLGSNTITVVVTAQDGTTKQTYTVMVMRYSADLSNLTLSEGTLTPSFASGTLNYTATVANSVYSVDVTPTLVDSSATLKVNSESVTSGSTVPINLSVGDNPITVVVTAQDGTSKTYTVTVTRLSNNANLSGLTLSTGTLAPDFAAGTTTYTTDVPYTTSSVDVTATVADSMASLKIDTNPAPSGSPVSKSLTVGSNKITIVVTAQDGTSKTYTVTVTRAAPSTDATLSNLTLSAGTLTPSFDSGATSYTDDVPYTTSSVDVTATVADNTASLMVNNSAAVSGSPISKTLTVGPNTITIVVTAQDGTPKTYTITVTRAAPSTDATLSNLTLSAGTLTPPFVSGTTTYTADVPYAVSSVDVTATSADGTATITVNGNSVTSGSARNVLLNLGSNIITVVVTAQDGTTKQTYTVTVTRLSNNANLSGLTLNTGTLAPGFASGTTTYTANVPYAVSSVDVTATVADSMASLKIDTNPTPSGSPVSKTLAVGSNTITVVVTAQDGTSKTYTVTVTRAAPSTVAILSNLTLSAGTLTPSFASGTTSYTAVVDSGVTSVDVTPTSADGTATITVDGNSVTSGSARNVLLNLGWNTITVVVTAQDGTTKQTYTVRVIKRKPGK